MPASEKARAMPRPMPLAAPVTKATFPFTSFIVLLRRRRFRLGRLLFCVSQDYALWEKYFATLLIGLPALFNLEACGKLHIKVKPCQREYDLDEERAIVRYQCLAYMNRKGGCQLVIGFVTYGR